MALVAFRLHASASPDVGNTSLSKTSVLIEYVSEDEPEPPEHAASAMLVIRASATLIDFICGAVNCKTGIVHAKPNSIEIDGSFLCWLLAHAL